MSALTFPVGLNFLFQPSRYKVAYGGRGSGKSWGFARALLILGMQKPMRILCAREQQASIQDSVHKLLSDQIDDMGFSEWYEVQKQVIYGKNGSEFIFAGIRSDPGKIKSFEGIDICWVEEAAGVSERSWDFLEPTIRKAGSEIWVSFNPDQATDPTYHKFIIASPPDSIVRKLSWFDNFWFPSALRAHMEHLARVDPESCDHIYGGECRTHSEAQVFRGKYRIEAFEPPDPSGSVHWDGPYFGADWGFAQDPSVLIKCWIHDRKLYVEHEAYGIGVELDDLPAMFARIPGSDKYVIRADNSRPETISHVGRKGMMRVEAATKWSGSVEDGVAFLKSFEVIILHPRCKHTADEFRLYSYKQDRLTGDVLPEIIDKSNHCIDGLRYSLDPMIRGKDLSIWARL
jgi:phage terminase large subunit